MASAVHYAFCIYYRHLPGSVTSLCFAGTLVHFCNALDHQPKGFLDCILSLWLSCWPCSIPQHTTTVPVTGTAVSLGWLVAASPFLRWQRTGEACSTSKDWPWMNNHFLPLLDSQGFTPVPGIASSLDSQHQADKQSGQSRHWPAQGHSTGQS